MPEVVSLLWPPTGGAPNNPDGFSHHSGGQKSKVKMSAGLIPPEPVREDLFQASGLLVVWGHLWCFLAYKAPAFIFTKISLRTPVTG